MREGLEPVVPPSQETGEIRNLCERLFAQDNLQSSRARGSGG
jgi:hypothetical protein